MTGHRPPRLARWFLELFVPDDARATVLGDLQEVFHTRVASAGATAAKLWYCGQALSFSLRFAAETLRETVDSFSRSALPSWLDVKLGVRMLVKSPLLTVTGCLAIATAIGVNAGANEFVGDLLSSRSNLEIGDEVVRIANLDIESGNPDPRAIEDLARWRQGLETVEDIGAGILLDMSFVGPDERPVSVNVAEMSASGFQVFGMVPILGRPLLESDDGPTAEPVAVLGYDTWQRYLGGDPNVVGTLVRVGETGYRVVGVAPDEYRFPSASDVWVNFRRDPERYPARAGPSVIVFGRLAEGRSLAEAEQEIAQFGTRTAADFPLTHANLRPSVTPFAGYGAGSGELIWGMRLFRSLLVLLLLVACANIATLVFARNARRESEIAVRNALGAGRSRIVMQLFAESMVLALVSAGIGLFIADWGLRQGSEVFWEVQRMEPPLWFQPGLSLTTVLYSLGLATLGAGVVGILPALRATGKRANQQLQRVGSGGSTLAFGKLPTAVIVVQIAIAVALIPIVLAGTVHDYQQRFISVSFPTERYVTARLLVDSEVQLTSAAADERAGASEGRFISVAGVTDRFRTGPALLIRYKEMRDNAIERLRREPGVRSVAYSSRLPGLLGQSIPAMTLEVDGQPPRSRGWYTRTATVDLEFFDIIGHEVVTGRALTLADYAPDQRVAVVNQAFVNDIFAGQNPVGHLVRRFERDGDNSRPWTEIVGVLPDDAGGAAASEPLVYYPLSGLGEYPMRVVMEVEGEPSDFKPRLRALIAGSEPGLILDEVLTLEEIRRSELVGELFGVVVLGLIALVTALLATAGVYSLMSFIVAQRTREIGIRTALGADPARVVRGIFTRTFAQLGLGVAVGLLFVGALGTEVLVGDTGAILWYAGGGVSVLLVAVGLVGCAIPVMRALRIQPTEALSADG